MGSVDFRVGGKIFATLASVKEGFGNLMLTPEMQAEFVTNAPEYFLPIKGGWGLMGATHVRLEPVPEDVLAGALRAAWQIRLQRNEKPSRTKKARSRRPTSR